MITLQTLLNQPTFRFLDHTENVTIFNRPNDPFASFAIDDTIATTVGQHVTPPTVRLWVHDKTLVLGIPDSRLPHIDQGIEYINQLGYDCIIRNSGGLAVLLEKGVLNMSLILPNKSELSIHDGYELMYQFIQYLFKEYTSDIKAYEIVGSYCPGDYDLSINGVKFAGISQRRVRDGVAVQIYIDVEGSSKERATIVKNFYELSTGGKQTNYNYPNVNPNVMGTINELLSIDMTVNDLIKHIYNVISNDGTKQIETNLLELERDIFMKRLEQMEKRNEKIVKYLQKK